MDIDIIGLQYGFWVSSVNFEIPVRILEFKCETWCYNINPGIQILTMINGNNINPGIQIEEALIVEL